MVMRPRKKAAVKKRRQRCPKCSKLLAGREKRCKTCHQVLAK